jgi:hypothetical protein
MQFSVYQQSHIGGRKVNQDRMGYCFTRDALLLVLADGMGGHLRGEDRRHHRRCRPMSALFQSRPPLCQEARALPRGGLAAGAPRHPAAYRARTGMPDKPAHHRRRLPGPAQLRRVGALRRLAPVLAAPRPGAGAHARPLAPRTPDRQGPGRPAERSTHPDRNKLYNCLGAVQRAAHRLSRQASLAPGDVLLLCSDGLWGMLPDAEIVHQLSTRTIVQAVPDMIGMATAIGGRAPTTPRRWRSVAGRGDKPAPGDASVISTQLLPEDEVRPQ